MARQTRTIVITFNHRIGLLGHLPYIDLEQSQQTAELAHHDHHQTRSNHALWDQIGLLHWIKHNVGHFGGDQNNVTLMAADNEAAATIQLLALSPLAKGHFKRIVLVHDSARTPSPPANYFDHLFRLAERSRQFRRKLVSELGLIVRRDESAPDPSDDQDPQQLDRRAFELLKSAPLARLALIEHELARVSVTMTSNSQQLATWTSLSQKQTPVSNLAQFVGEPNLDDKLLFPFFAQLIKANQSLGGGGDHEPSVSFWSSLRHSVEWATSTVDPNSSLENLQLESDYCLYMQRLYSSMFEAESLSGSHQHENVTNELNQFDPLKLIPRLSDHQLMMMLNLSVAINVSSSPPQAPLEEDLQHQQTRQFIRWTGQKNRTANALEFHHLHRAHLMQQLLIQKLERHFNLTSGPSSTATIRPRDLTVGIQVDDNEDEEEGEPAASIQQQQQQRSISLMQQQQAGAGLSRTKRDVLDQLAALAKQCIELLGSFDLLVVFAGAPTSQRVDNVELVTKNNSLIETMNDLVSSDLAKTLESGFQDYLHLADLHRVSSLHQAPGHLNELCQFKRLQNSSHLRVRLQASSRIQASIRSGFVLLVDQEEETGPMVSDRTFFTKSNANVTQMIANFAASGQLTSNQSDQYQTLDRPLVGVGQQREDDGVLRDLMSIQLDLVPYLLIHPEQHPPEMVSCLRELELILLNDDGDKTRRLAMANLTLVRFQEESHCLTNVTNKLRNQLRSGAAKELEPVIRQYFATLNEQQRQLKSSPSSDDRQQQMALVDAASAAVRHNSQRASPMTTRNLLNHLEGPYLDQMAPPLAGFLDHQQTLDGGGGGGGGNLSGAYQTVRVGNGHQKSAAPNSTSGNIRSFFTKNYKDAVSQALAIVLGTGFLIFVLNLVIVLVIAIRSRGSVRSQTCNVQESSLADGDLAGMTNTTNLTALTGAQQQQLTIPPLSLLNGLIDLATANGSLDVGKQLVTGKMLTSSFKGPQQTSHPEELHQQHSMRQLPAQQSRSSLSSNSQRVSKSIKFDLTGTEGQDQRMTMRIGSNNNSTLQSTWSTADSGQYRTKSIMKQQPTTSDEDELQLTDHQMLPANNNNCLHYHIESPYLLDVDPNSPMANGRLLSPLNSLDHLTPIMNTGGYESEDFELQALAMMTGHDHQHQALLADSNNSDKCQHHYHLVRQQHHGPQASLGSSSLNSPFASQSTPTHSGSNGQIFAIMVSAQDQLLLDEQRQ